MKRCLFITTIDSTIMAFLMPHIEMLMDKGVTVDIATNVNSNPSKLSDRINGEVYDIPFSRKMFSKDNLISYLKVKKLLKNNDFNFIHVHTPVASFITRIACSLKNKVLYTAHGFHINEKGSVIKNKLFFGLEKIATIKSHNDLIVINNYDLKIANTLGIKGNVHKIDGVGIDTSIFSKNNIPASKALSLRKELSINSNDIIITHIAEFNDNKRQIDILHAVLKLKDIYSNFKVLLIGSGENLTSVQAFVRDNNLSNYILVLGQRDDIAEVLSITDIGLLVSIREGLPRSVMEMMSMEIPVVVTSIRGNMDLIDDGGEGFYVPIKDSNSIKEKLSMLIEDEDLRTLMGKRARDKILNRFSLTKVLNDLDKVYSRYL